MTDARVSEREARALLQAAIAIGGELELNARLDRVLDATLELLGVDAAQVALVDTAAGEIETVAERGLGRRALGVRQPLGAGLTGAVLAASEPVYSPDVLADPRTLNPVFARARGVRSWLGVRLADEQGVYGTLTVLSHHVDAFTADHQRLLLSFAALAGAAVHAARLYTDAIRDLVVAKQAAEEASRQKSEFLANMSHELRTPLNGIIGFAELMHDGKVGPVSGEHREYLGDILTSSRHLLQLINNVLDLAKVEAGMIDLAPERVDLASTVRQVCDTLRLSAAQKRIEIALALDPALPEVVTDPGKLRQVLYNYVSNALKFTPDGGSVTIRAMPEPGERFRLEVEDTGIGIVAEDLGRLFVVFQQLDASVAKKYQGTGLGLALTRRLVEAQGGQVGVRSSPGHGSVFFAVLPLRPR